MWQHAFHVSCWCICVCVPLTGQCKRTPMRERARDMAGCMPRRAARTGVRTLGVATAGAGTAQVRRARAGAFADTHAALHRCAANGESVRAARAHVFCTLARGGVRVRACASRARGGGHVHLLAMHACCACMLRRASLHHLFACTLGPRAGSVGCARVCTCALSHVRRCASRGVLVLWTRQRPVVDQS